MTAVFAHTLMVALTTVALFAYLAPAYARPAGFADGDVPHVVKAQFDSLVNLRGYEVRGTAVHPGDPIDLDLYWEVTAQPPGNYLLFVHLSDDNGIIVAQRDTHPGLGNFPASQWQPGDRFVESIRLYLPETAYTPAQATLSIGLYAPDAGYRLGISEADGSGLGDALVLAEVAIVPLPGEFPNPLAQNFNNEILLQGYEYDTRTLSPGGEMTVTLYWQALQAGVADYVVQVHVVGEEGRVWKTADHRPDPHTNQWTINQQIQSQHHLILPPDIPPGSYTIHVALLDTARQTRQNIVAEDGHWINDHLLLAKVLVK